MQSLRHVGSVAWAALGALALAACGEGPPRTVGRLTAVEGDATSVSALTLLDQRDILETRYSFTPDPGAEGTPEQFQFLIEDRQPVFLYFGEDDHVATRVDPSLDATIVSFTSDRIVVRQLVTDLESSLAWVPEPGAASDAHIESHRLGGFPIRIFYGPGPNGQVAYRLDDL